MSSEGGNKAVVAALLANTGIAITKFVAFFLTGFSSMLAEAIHSVADSGNQGLLLLGGKKSQKDATEEHPFGYGRERYIYAFIVSIVLFSVGGLFALYEAWHKYHEIHAGHVDPVDDWRRFVPVAVLVVAIVLEGLSFRTAIAETNKIRGQASFATFVRRAKQPELPVILLEDLAALLGLVFALVGVGLSLITGNEYWDAAGTALIGLLLVVVAVVLAVETKSLLLGESASAGVQKRIVGALESTPGVERIIHMKTMHLGPEELLVAAKIGVPPGVTSEQVAASIDAAEVAIRGAEASAQVIYLEPDIYREDHVPAERPEPPAPAGH
ncbi:cation diffusion facilitator family transporter [Nocardioides ginsengisegetis]|uniref:Cation diffusion facilitator family transporter n=1 Tax=Nocardioides ginsengisegetis TaxID=661491 RepID=A0A7W3IXL8_9ACTN|nr:cation diffusion facilitator family transporter [Nocardioides ginsengisegetis]MBA8802359.1 cation diffusion facilitator family transporter [Nocardioides ginsengisegetis]